MRFGIIGDKPNFPIKRKTVHDNFHWHRNTWVNQEGNFYKMNDSLREVYFGKLLLHIVISYNRRSRGRWSQECGEVIGPLWIRIAREEHIARK